MKKVNFATVAALLWGVLLLVLSVEVAVLANKASIRAESSPASVTASSAMVVDEFRKEYSEIVAKLDRVAGDRIDSETSGINQALAELQAQIDWEQEMEELRAQAQQALEQEYAEMLEAQRKLQEQLDQKALADIEASGGHSATSSDVVYFGSDNLTTPVIESTAPTTPTPNDDPYRGQFIAEVICTCDKCFAEVGSEFSQTILANPEYLMPGQKVTLENGLSGVFVVRDGGPRTSGRAIYIYTTNHTEASAATLIYPKIYESEE